MAEKEGRQFHLANKNMKTDLRCKNSASVHVFLVLLCPLCVYLPVCFPKERKMAWYWMGREVGRTWEMREGDCDQKNKTKDNFQLEKVLFTLDNCNIYFFSRLQTELVAVAGGVGLYSLSFLRAEPAEAK